MRTIVSQKPSRLVLEYTHMKKKLADAGFYYGSSSGNEDVLRRFRSDIVKLERLSLDDMRIVFNPVVNQYELYVRRTNRDLSRKMTRLRIERIETIA